MKKLLLLLTCLPFTLSAQNFWTESTPFGRGSYYAKNISIADESTVWVTGTDDPGFGSWSVPRWGRSTDGGLTWTSGFLPDDVVWPAPSNQFVVDICAISDQTAYVGIAPDNSNSSNKILVTHDAGNTWTQIHPELFSDATSFLNGIHFLTTIMVLFMVILQAIISKFTLLSMLEPLGPAHLLQTSRHRYQTNIPG